MLQDILGNNSDAVVLVSGIAWFPGWGAGRWPVRRGVGAEHPAKIHGRQAVQCEVSGDQSVRFVLGFGETITDPSAARPAVEPHQHPQGAKAGPLFRG